MTEPGPFTARADRILDAAGELLLRYGHGKVTIEDVARRAKIGKGTVYLHWRTKDEVFLALLARESVRMTEQISAVLRADPEEVRPHRLARRTFQAVLEQPLLLAVATRDPEILGRLAETELNDVGIAATEQFFDLLTEYGLLRTDVPNLPYAMRAAGAGFYVLEQADPSIKLDAEARLDAMAHVVRSSFEPARSPRRSVLVAAAEAIATVFDDMIPPYRAWIYQERGNP